MGTRRLFIVALVTGMLLAVAAPAWAHVHVSAESPEPGAVTTYTVAVPNESSSASTVLIEMQLPEELEAVTVEPQAGWDASVEDGVLMISGGEIPTGETGEFRFDARNPDAAAELTFPTLQTYDDGEVAEWTGPPDSDSPAPRVARAAGDLEAGTSGTAPPAHGPTTGAEAAPPTTVAEAAPPTTVTPTDSPTQATAPATDVAGAGATSTVDATPLPTGAEGGGRTAGIVAIVAVFVVLAAGGYAYLRSRP